MVAINEFPGVLAIYGDLNRVPAHFQAKWHPLVFIFIGAGFHTSVEDFLMRNAYDQSAFFANYSSMPRSVGGLEEAGEWHAFRALLPDLRDKRLLDLGCGFGWHCRYAREQHARLVLGVDSSEKMLARAHETNNDGTIEYRRMAIEDIDFPAIASTL